jgi:antirestriction protein ArdC
MAGRCEGAKKGTQIEFWEVKQEQAKSTASTPAGAEQDSARPERTEARRLIHRVYTVFNASQIEGVPARTPKQHSTFQAVHAGEQILQNSGATIVHDQADRAFYSRGSDSIHLPPKDSFKTAPGYYGTALHELSHWSGHPSRLNRSTLTESYRFGDVNYAKEELRAELASVFLAAERGIPHDPEQHAAYVGSWIKSLKEDKNKIFRAAHDASAAADFLLGLERDRSVAEESLQAEPAIDTSGNGSPSVPQIEQETARLDRDREQLDETSPERTDALESSSQNAFRSGDKIIAKEPYYYGGRPKKNPDTPGIVQSLYNNGSMVS